MGSYEVLHRVGWLLPSEAVVGAAACRQDGGRYVVLARRWSGGSVLDKAGNIYATARGPIPAGSPAVLSAAVQLVGPAWWIATAAAHVAPPDVSGGSSDERRLTPIDR